MAKQPAPAEVKINSVTEFLSQIFLLSSIDGVRCFRGQANRKWDLKPSVMRDLKKNAESSVITELMAEAAGDFSDDRTMFSKLVRAQHYSLPTRLLDVSLNPLVGLFFACSDEPNKEHDGKVIIMDFRKENIKYPDSDTISLICNISRLSDEERDELWDATKNRSRTDITDLDSAKRLIEFVKMEKPYFTNSIDTRDLRKYFFVHPSKTNKRVAAQSGAFVATGLLPYVITKRIVSFSFSEIFVPAASKSSILRELDLLNINPRSLFPEIEFAAKYIKKKWENSPSSDLEDLMALG